MSLGRTEPTPPFLLDNNLGALLTAEAQPSPNCLTVRQDRVLGGELCQEGWNTIPKGHTVTVQLVGCSQHPYRLV